MKKSASFVVILLILAGYIFILLKDAGTFRKINSLSFGTCQKYGPIIGPEDMVSLPNKKILISSDPRDEHLQGPPGGIFILNLQSKELLNLTAEMKLPFAFHPHGFDILETPESILIYVVNHRSLTDTVIEVFSFKNDLLSHVKTLEDPNFQSGNDIAVIAEDRFYLSSDFGTSNKLLQKITQYLRRPTGYVSYFDGQKARQVINNVFYANGLSLDDTKKTLFVAGMLGKSIGIYDISSNTPVFLKSIEVNGAPDNIIWHQNKLYVGAHPKLLSLKKESEVRSAKAPSQVIVYADLQADMLQSQVLYENTGDEISSVSVALPIAENRILLGSVFDGHILDCQK